MFPARSAGIDASAYEFDARYQPQPTEDGQLEGKTHRSAGNRANYKPTPLRWYFVLANIIVVVILMGLVIWALVAMPHSNSTAKISNHKRWNLNVWDLFGLGDSPDSDIPASVYDLPADTPESDRAALALRWAAQEYELRPRQHNVSQTGSSAGKQTGVTSESGSGGNGSPTKTGNDQDAPMTANRMALGTTVFVSHYTSVVTRPETTKTFVTSVPTTIYSTYMTYSTKIEGGSTSTKAFTSVVETVTEVPTVIQGTGAGGASEIVGTSTEWVIITPSPGSAYGNSSVAESVGPISSSILHTYTSTVLQSAPASAITTMTQISVTYTSTGTSTVVESGTTSVFSEQFTSAVATSSVESVGTTTAAAETYIQLGRTTITSIYTEPPSSDHNDNSNDPDHKNDSGDSNDPNNPRPTPSVKVVDVVTDTPDKTIKEVKQLGPTVIVTSVNDVETLTWSQPAETLVTQLPAYETTVPVVTTNSNGIPTTIQVVSMVSGSLSTIITTPGPTTFTTTRSGKKLTTFTSTRSGKTTILSTRKGTTRTYESTTTVTPTGSEPTATDDAGRIKATPIVFDLNQSGYFLGKFLPTLLAVIISIPLRIIDLNAQLFQPFYSMNENNGALGPSSMTLHYSGWAVFVKPIQTLREGHPIPFITMLIVWSSALLTPLATEAIGVKLHGNCTLQNPGGCAPALGVSPISTGFLLALMAIIVVLLLLLLYFLRNRETGLYANPWSIAGIASLATNAEIRPRKMSERKIEKEMTEKRFGFGYFENAEQQTEYGIVLLDDAGQDLRNQDGGLVSETSSLEAPVQKDMRKNPFIALGWAWRLGFILFLTGVVVLVGYYSLAKDYGSGFRDFMNSQSFGIRFFFAALGVIMVFGWTTLFISVASIWPYWRMAATPQVASESILITRPTNGYYGLYASVKYRQIYVGLVALMTILSDFMPILLSNIPYTVTQTKMTHVVCARLSLSIMAVMILVAISSFFIRWPHMPVDPRSVAGAMYYVAESNLVDHLHGVAAMDRHERDQRVKQFGGRYWFGAFLTKAGETRIGVEREDGTLDVEQHDPILPVSPVSSSAHRQNYESIDTGYYGYQPESNYRPELHQPRDLYSVPEHSDSPPLSPQLDRHQEQDDHADLGYYGVRGYGTL